MEPRRERFSRRLGQLERHRPAGLLPYGRPHWFAAERTYAAWVRTGLVALASGIGARKLLDGIVPVPLVIAK